MFTGSCIRKFIRFDENNDVYKLYDAMLYEIESIGFLVDWIILWMCFDMNLRECIFEKECGFFLFIVGVRVVNW